MFWRRRKWIYSVFCVGLLPPLIIVVDHLKHDPESGRQLVFASDYRGKSPVLLGYNQVNVLDKQAINYLDGVRNPCFFSSSDNLHCLPKVFIIGFAKAGTTDLHFRITRHQYVLGGRVKEPHWWDSNRKDNTLLNYTDQYSMATDVIKYICQPGPNRTNYSEAVMYRAHAAGKFPWRLTKKDISSMSSEVRQQGRKCPFLLVDATPKTIQMSYTPDDANFYRGTDETYLIAQKIHHLIPDARILISLRNPTDRLYSDYKWFCQGDVSPEHFHTMVQRALGWWNKCLHKFHLSLQHCTYGYHFPKELGSPEFGQYRPTHKFKDIFNASWYGVAASRLRMGIYHVYIEKILETFPKNQVYISKFELFTQNTTHYTTNEIFPFLGLPNISGTRLKLLEKSEDTAVKIWEDKPNRKFPMKDETRRLLEDFYAPYNRKLAKVLGDKFYNTW